MADTIYELLNSYFNHLCNTGYVKQSSVNKILAMTIIQELIDKDFRGLISKEDYNAISKALYCLYGSDCLIPYPDYYSGKNKRIMYTGSLSELIHRVESVEEVLDVLENDVIIPGDEGTNVADLDVELETEPSQE